MKALKFNLSGKTAFFKKPDVNSYFYFTYGHIHKVALMGIFGAIMGYGGYNQQLRNKKLEYPEFYEKLKDIRIGIKPEEVVNDQKEDNKFQSYGIKGKQQKGYFNKKIQTFNNTVGYANTDGNLIVNEQWLEDPCWDIYLLLRSEVEEEIADCVINAKTAFIPYLGKNDHMAIINEAEIIDLDKPNLMEPFCIDSLYLKEYFKAYTDEKEWEFFQHDLENPTFKYEERLPIALEKTTNQYITTPIIYTNGKVVMKNYDFMDKVTVYRSKDRIIHFF